MYLARYLRGGPVKNHRLCGFDGQNVSLRCRRHRGRNGRRALWVTRSLPAPLFVGRLLEHVPPRGFHVVRSGGLYAGGQPGKLDRARAALAGMVPGAEQHPPARQPSVPAPPSCPICGLALRVVPWLPIVPTRQATPKGPLPAGKSP